LPTLLLDCLKRSLFAARLAIDPAIAWKQTPTMQIKSATRKPTLLVAAVLFALPCVMQAQFTCTTNNGVVTITGYTGNPTKLSIPSVTNGYPVTSIGFSAFANFTALTTVFIPGSITNVGNGTFGGCIKLTGVYFQGNAPGLGWLRCIFPGPQDSRLLFAGNHRLGRAIIGLSHGAMEPAGADWRRHIWRADKSIWIQPHRQQQSGGRGGGLHEPDESKLVATGNQHPG
jgi:hypothetical protein